MPRFITLYAFCLFGFGVSFAQGDNSQEVESLKSEHLKEVIVIGENPSPHNKATKPLATLDKYLEKASTINMIRRGSYAWEPFLNGMASERSVITIDGMRIYQACTDKMDPITSYVEITNLAKANVHSGQSGSAGGATIAGSLDLVRKKSSFGGDAFKGMVFSGFEANNQHKVIGGTLSHSDSKFFADIDFTFRNAENYKAGGSKEILYSQFTKGNMSAIAGYKINEHQALEASLIYDRAVNIGYPALTMDVALAKAIISSLEYTRYQISSAIPLWQTKIYYNEVTHIMDDSKRPIVPIRMNMPGWSKTAGFYARLQGNAKRHNWKANISGHINKSLAQMTMYANTLGEKDMFMLTWPEVYTYYGDIFVEDYYTLSKRWTLTFSGGIGVQNNMVNSQFGLESLQIFYPDIQNSKTRVLKRLSTVFQYEAKNWQYTAGAAYGERAPSVSEGYGFYLFNSFDRFDYIGNPNMKNEKSTTFNGAVSYSQSRFSAKISSSYFYIIDYIIGRPQPAISAMTVGAAGIKMYEQLKYANIFNISFDLNYQITKKIQWTNRFGYRIGTGKDVGNLPLMQPFTYTSSLAFSMNSFFVDVTLSGATKHDRFNPEFGEKPLSAYSIVNVSASNRFKLGKQSLLVKAGVENLLDKNYTTFADWNRLPRMGRNIFVNLIWGF